MPRVRENAEHSLARALAAAKADAKELRKRVFGGTRDDGTSWFYADSDDVAREADKLFAKHGLNLEFWREIITSRGDVQVRYRLVHLESMGRRFVTWTAPPHGLGPLGVSITGEIALRNLRLHVLGIRCVEDSSAVKRPAPAGQVTRVGSGVVRPRETTHPPQQDPPGELRTRFIFDNEADVALHALKVWSANRNVLRWDENKLVKVVSSRVPQDLQGCAIDLRVDDEAGEFVCIVPLHGTGGGLVDPGPLGGEDSQ